MSSDEEEASHVIVVKGIYTLGESLFFEVEMSTMGKPFTDEEGSVSQTQQLDGLWNVGVSPGQEAIILRIKWQTQDIWSRRK